MLIIKNKTTGETLACQVKPAFSFSLRLKGLLGKKLQKGEGLLLFPCFCVHTLFQREKIDAIFLSLEKKVLEVKVLRPGMVWASVPGAKFVLELPEGTCDGVRPGHYLDW